MNKLRFYLSLHAARLGWKRRAFAALPDQPAPTAARHPLSVFFWTPTANAGAKIIVHDMLPALRNVIARVDLPWKVAAGPEIPNHPIDVLISFKALPPSGKLPAISHNILLICDQVELFLDHLKSFDAVVATASRPLAQLLANHHPKVSFIPETETPETVRFGSENLKNPPSQRNRVLMWHGGPYSLGPLEQLRPILESNAALKNFELHLVGGQADESADRWGNLRIRLFPWSEDRLHETAGQAMLGLAPAHASVRRSWLKPASRVRCLYGMGVPAIGDANVPDVVSFTSEFGAPSANGPSEWNAALTRLLTNPAELDRLAIAGHARVANHHSSAGTCGRWINYLSGLTPPKVG